MDWFYEVSVAARIKLYAFSKAVNPVRDLTTWFEEQIQHINKGRLFLKEGVLHNIKFIRSLGCFLISVHRCPVICH